jgi:ubiquinone/menaquinone biosynthesis C-methylase UbiE
MTHAHFAGTIPETYDRHLGPLLFEPYAADLAARIEPNATRILELACGTGRLTRHVLARLPHDGRLVATDLNRGMLEVGKAHVAVSPRLEWREADATRMPFESGTFDAVLCQFGFMFFPDKPAASREIARVLEPGGRLLFSVWDSIAENPLPRIAHETIGSFFEGDPPDFYQVPFGFHDAGAIRTMLDAAGFSATEVETVRLTGEGPSPEHVAVGLVRGNPVLNAIEERGTTDPQVIIDAVAAELRRAFGGGPVRAPMQALVVAARKTPVV